MKKKRPEDCVLDALLSQPGRMAKNPINDLLNLISKVEDKLYNKTGKLLYEYDKKLDDSCRRAIDSRDETEIAIVSKKLSELKFLGNLDKEYYISNQDSEVPLSDLGREQAKKLIDTSAMKSVLSNMEEGLVKEGSLEKPVIIYSPYSRATETFRLFEKSARVTYKSVLDKMYVFEDPLVIEHEYHQDPKSVKEVNEDLEEVNLKGRAKYFHRFPGGESYADVELRVATFIENINRRYLKEDCNLIIFCHGHTQMIFLKRLMNLTVDEFCQLAHLENCEFTTFINLGGDRYRIESSMSCANNQIESLDNIFSSRRTRG